MDLHIRTCRSTVQETIQGRLEEECESRAQCRQRRRTCVVLVHRTWLGCAKDGRDAEGLGGTATAQTALSTADGGAYQRLTRAKGPRKLK